MAASMLAGLLVAAAPASAGPNLGCSPIAGGYRCVSGPYTVNSGSNEFQGLSPAPPVAGYVTSAGATLIDENGAPLPRHHVHLHHGVWINPTETDLTCSQFAERFFATGKERTVVSVPAGYGYWWSNESPPQAPLLGPTWFVVAELDNMRSNEPMQAYLQLDVGFAQVPQGSLTDVRPVWLDVRNCQQDPVFDVPRRPKRSRFRERWTYTMPVGGEFVAIGGHLHDGGKKLALVRTAGGEEVFTSRARYDLPRRPWFLTRMTSFSGTPGKPVSAGETLLLTAVYSAKRRWKDVMGIMVGMLAPSA
jgi:hypothetical protein